MSVNTKPRFWLLSASQNQRLPLILAAMMLAAGLGTLALGYNRAWTAYGSGPSSDKDIMWAILALSGLLVGGLMWLARGMCLLNWLWVAALALWMAQCLYWLRTGFFVVDGRHGCEGCGEAGLWLLLPAAAFAALAMMLAIKRLAAGRRPPAWKLGAGVLLALVWWVLVLAFANSG